MTHVLTEIRTSNEFCTQLRTTLNTEHRRGRNGTSNNRNQNYRNYDVSI